MYSGAFVLGTRGLLQSSAHVTSVHPSLRARRRRCCGFALAGRRPFHARLLPKQRPCALRPKTA
jgi:hypothetical protein